MKWRWIHLCKGNAAGNIQRGNPKDSYDDANDDLKEHMKNCNGPTTNASVINDKDNLWS